jgi:hypothetical protein
MSFGIYNLISTRKQNNLTNLLSLCLTSHDEVANTDKKTTTGLPSGSGYTFIPLTSLPITPPRLVPVNCLFVCLMMFISTNFYFQQYFSYIVAISFIGGGNRMTRTKPPTCRKSLTNLIT